ncbi:arabinan endo-1,5-alpha-L-arabinosidase [Halalkalibacter urbisdiaboli]|uniref:arabinan endo-1,5-alpha-L-arabinosidase n=1 Tax=Halalkalibacter urbisdiaboli TaxID=1960589 RepID=UPI000B4408F3|nr:arabinan endo-1,5-alpha-L-arabinosidase [Halalkalibacter urbisdiaboli]
MRGPVKPPNYLSEVERALNDNPQEWSIYNAHDPSIFKDGDTYYVFSTDTKTSSTNCKIGAGAQIRKSSNLIDWEWVGHALEGVPKDAFEWTQAKGLWAPEVVKWNGTYFLYYCASQFGTNQSFIGVATSSSINGPWHDRGEVLKTSKKNKPNGIDPNLITDKNGTPYMIYGSFFGGIYAVKLDKTTGKLAEPNDEGICIAKRENETKEGAVEGPYMIYHPEYDYYYLFVSYDSLFSNYNVRVGRSKEITGPFLDYNGKDLSDDQYRPSDEIGTKLLAGYQFQDGDGWMAPGHNSILEDEGQYYICHHARIPDKKDLFCMQIRQMLWTETGWPLISPQRYAGEEIKKIDKSEMIGKWDTVKFIREKDGMNHSFIIEIYEDSKLNMLDKTYQWEKTGDITVHLSETETGETIELKFLEAWDWKNEQKTIVFTGMDSTGTCLIGKKLI